MQLLLSSGTCVSGVGLTDARKEVFLPRLAPSIHTSLLGLQRLVTVWWRAAPSPT